MRIRKRVLRPVAAVASTALTVLAGSPAQATTSTLRAEAAAVDVLVHGFLMTGSRLTPIEVPGVQATFPSAINDRGWIAGSYGEVGVQRHGFVWDKLGFTSFDVPGATGTADPDQ